MADDGYASVIFRFSPLSLSALCLVLAFRCFRLIRSRLRQRYRLPAEPPSLRGRWLSWLIVLRFLRYFRFRRHFF